MAKIEDKNNGSNKVAVITGASSGIGSALAIEFAKNNYNIAICARRIGRLMSLGREINETYNVDVFVSQSDISSKQSCENFINKTIEHYGKIDVLVNNAGISQRALFNDLDLEDFQKIIDTNYWGTVYCTKFALPYLLKSKGSVVAISSISGFSPLPGRTGYCSSKYAIHGFLESLRIENLKTGLHVMIVAPGFTASEIREKAVVAGGKEQGTSPRDEAKMMTPERVAEKVLRGIRIRKRTIIMTPMGIAAVWLTRLLPELMDRIIYYHLKKEDNENYKLLK
ncbi:MAG: SDR family oxidoreductase [Bacteroidales bacterium]|nr:SDR family oxidoreductase [Bacteroidales bacterium]